MGIHLLIAEDDWGHRELLQMALQDIVETMYFVDSAEDMFIAIRNHPEINGLILNMKLNGKMRGDDAYLCLHKQGFHLPCIFLTVTPSELIPSHQGIVEVVNKVNCYDNNFHLIEEALVKMKEFLLQ